MYIYMDIYIMITSILNVNMAVNSILRCYHSFVPVTTITLITSVIIPDTAITVTLTSDNSKCYCHE